MRINLCTLDPSSPLAARINAALARQMPRATQNLTADGQLATDSTSDRLTQIPASGQTCESESLLHDAVVKLLRASASPAIFWTHFPAGEKRSEATGRKLARMGTKPGVPDFALVIDGRACFIELKTRTGKLSAMQKQTHAALIRAGAEVAVVRCFQSAADVLRRRGALV